MGLLDTSLQIGRSAIMAHSLAIDVTGNNIANAATEGYARRAADLRSLPGIKTSEGPYLGLGVRAAAIRRLCPSRVTCNNRTSAGCRNFFHE